MILFLAIITLLYMGLMLFLLYGYYQIPEKKPGNESPKIRFSIVVPFRNEAGNLALLLNSLRKISYPNAIFETLLVNDASEDTSEEICLEFMNRNPEMQMRLLQNERHSGSPKKDALTTALKRAKFEYILTTDADCELPTHWLGEFNSELLRTEADLLAGPVELMPKAKNRLLLAFQQMDIFSLQLASMGGFGTGLAFMCNGANLCYSKKAFLEVDGFEGNSEIASGDDIFLLEKFRRNGLKTSFLKSRQAVVTTRPQPDLKSLFSQRIRWAAKTSAYKNFFGKFTGIIVLLMNLGLIAGSLAVLSGYLTANVFFLVFLIKFNLDFILIYTSAQFFGKENILKSYFWSSFLYPFFSSTVAILSLFSGYSWKGRRFKK